MINERFKTAEFAIVDHVNARAIRLAVLLLLASLVAGCQSARPLRPESSIADDIRLRSMAADYLSARSEVHAQESARQSAGESPARAAADARLAESRKRLARLEKEIIDYVLCSFVGPKSPPLRQD